MSFLQLHSVAKTFKGHKAVHEVSLSIDRGEFVSFLGPSGCGKTTTLRMVAGFEMPSAGHIRIDERDVTHLLPAQRDVGMVFQSYALFPNLTVAGNIGFGLKVARKPQAEVRSRIDELLAMIKLPELAGRYPRQLSGGQQQRVALARALANRPKVLLLDEPLSALDAAIRVSLRDEIRALQRQLGITTIYVTHDQEEALSMSDRVVVMNEGRIEQVGSPLDIYNEPRTRFVASFVGRLSVLTGTVVDPAAGRLSLEGQAIHTAAPIEGSAVGDYRSIAIRPEAIVFATPAPGQNGLTGTVAEVRFLGATIRVDLNIGRATLTVDMANDPARPSPVRGETATVAFARERVLLLDG